MCIIKCALCIHAQCLLVGSRLNLGVDTHLHTGDSRETHCFRAIAQWLKVGRFDVASLTGLMMVRVLSGQCFVATLLIKGQR